jgi:hypothetical protein
MAAAILFFLSACAPTRPLTPVSAGMLAAKLANERCQKTYGQRPFHSEDFEASLDQGRWHWGTDDGGKVDGFEVEVSFDRTGSERQVMVRIPPEE